MIITWEIIIQKNAEATYPAVDVSEARVLPKLRIMAISEDRKIYQVIAEHPSGDVTILVKDALFTPKADGSFTVLKADVVDFIK